MSTRSYICRENEDGTYTGIYCHSDGYLTHNGAILIDHYQERDKVDKLMDLGCLSYLQPKIEPDPDKPHSFDYNDRQDGVCVFYGRDRGEKEQESFAVALEEVGQNDWIEYCYVFTQDARWKYFEPNEDSVINLRDVEADLNTEFKGYGIDRPPNEYGWFSKEEIAKLKAEQKQNCGSEM